MNPLLFQALVHFTYGTGFAVGAYSTTFALYITFGWDRWCKWTAVVKIPTLVALPTTLYVTWFCYQKTKTLPYGKQVCAACLLAPIIILYVDNVRANMRNH